MPTKSKETKKTAKKKQAKKAARKQAGKAGKARKSGRKTKPESKAKGKSARNSETRPYREATYPSARRIAHLVADFPRNTIGRRLSGVCQQFGVDEQTIRRDVKMLGEEFQGENGEPVFRIETRGDGDKWLVRRPAQSDLSEATIYHLVSMYLSLEFLKLFEGKIIAPPIEQIMEKIERMIPSSQRGLLREFSRKFFAAPSPCKDYSSEECADVLEDVITAVVYQTELSIRYKKLGRDEPWWMRVLPLTLLYHRGSLYLIAIKKGYKSPVYYNVERIKDAKPHRDEHFEYPKDYKPQQMLDGAFGVFGRGDEVKTFRVKFPPGLKEYIMYWKVHETQEFEEQDDGSVVLTMRVTDSEEVRAWIRSFGESVEIV